MKLSKGDRFKNYMGHLCFISYIRGDIVKLTYIQKDSFTEVWDRNEFLEEIERNRFYPEPKVKITRLNITDHLVEYQLNMIGRTTSEALKDDMWFYNWTLTTRQYEQFKGYAISLLKRVFKFNTKKANATFDWFNLQFGLRIKD